MLDDAAVDGRRTLQVTQLGEPLGVFRLAVIGSRASIAGGSYFVAVSPRCVSMG
jgi:hypothetical protein